MPGPTLRATEGERLRVVFKNDGSHPHTIHFHGFHPANMDGAFELVGPGQEFVYEFDAEPAGLHLHHCHTSPLRKHIEKGLYGAFIVDPEEGRPEADELVMIMNGFDTNFDASNEVYAVNTVAFHYQRHPIEIRKGRLIRAYVVNVSEFDFVNSFHTHATFFEYYPTDGYEEPQDRQARSIRVYRHQDLRPGGARDHGVSPPLPRQVHVPLPRQRVRRARLDGPL